jgi:hypothetical protein
MTGRAYITTFTALALIGFALIAALGLVVDAYGLFGTRLIPAPRFPPQLRLVKRWDRVTKAIEIAERRGDQVLFIGDSRSQRGLDPDSPALSGAKAYNAALVGATLAEQIVALDWSLAHDTGIKHVVWGVSFETFPFGIFPLSDYSQSAFAGNSIISGLLRHLFAYDYVVSSWRALKQARKLVRTTMKRNGVVIYSGEPVEGSELVQFFESELKSTSRNISGPLEHDALDKAHADLTQTLLKLKAAGIDVDLVILPVHMWRLIFYREIGVEAQSDEWKRRLAAMVEELAKAPGSGRVRFFDFERAHPFVEQPVLTSPPPGERRYYLESSHFYTWLGDKVLAKLFGKAQDAENEEEPFGRAIGKGADATSIDEDVVSARAALDRWETAHPDEVSHVKRLISK